MKKRIILIIVIILIFLVGLSVMLYPLVSDYLNAQRQSRVVAQYFTDLEDLTQEDFNELFRVARDYNAALQHNNTRFVLTDADEEEYFSLLNPFGNGMMGILIIDKINVNLPIYHGTSEGVLQLGAGHFEGSSMPVGGAGTHTVISGHRGLPSSILLTDLDQMEIGDTFVLNILGEVLTYKIDQIIVVEPHEIEALAIDPEKDNATLVTCTPYGVNSHRMLVRGIRTANEETEIETPARTPVDLVESEPIDVKLVAALLFAPAFVTVTIIVGVKLKGIYGKKED